MLNFIEAFDVPNCGKLPKLHGSMYNKILAPYQAKDIRMLEIGVWHGIPFRAYKEYFDKVKLFGLDMFVGDNDIFNYGTFFFGDQSYKKFTDKTASTIGSLDIIIDDGGHWCDDQQVSFNSFWPILNKGGVYVIEDLWVANDRILDGYESTLVFLEKLEARKEYYLGNNGFEKDTCVIYKD